MMLHNFIFLMGLTFMAGAAQAENHAPGTQQTSQISRFSPPLESEIPDDGFGAMVRKGRDIFINTQINAKE